MSERWVLQICHCHYGPFADVARQWAALFHGTGIRVTTVYLTGESNEIVAEQSASDEVHFLEFSSRDMSGLKISAIRQVKNLAKRHPYESIIAHRFKSIHVACLATRLPVIGVHHAFGDYERQSRKLFARWFRPRLELVGVSNAVRDEIRTKLPWMKKQIHTLHNRIDVERVQSEFFSRQAARERLELHQEAWVIGNVGRLHPDKDQATLIRGFALALPRLPSNSVLAIMGSGKLEGDLKRLSRELGVETSVRFLGQVPEGRKYFKAFDAFVLSSDHEPFGMVLLEAMAANVPVLATDCGGAPEVVGDADRLFPLHGVDRLAALLVEQAHGQAALSAPARAVQRLHESFSDNAARQRFFALSALPAVLATPKTSDTSCKHEKFR